MATFNIDEMKQGFEPAEVIFRGEEYVMGGNAMGVMDACEIHGTIEDKDGTAYMAAFLKVLPQMLKALCPSFPDDVELDTGEQFSLVKVCTEVLGRVGRLTFQETAGTE